MNWRFNHIETIIIGIITTVLGIALLIHHLYLYIHYGPDYKIIGFSRLAGHVITPIKSAFRLDAVVIVIGIVVILYGIYKRYFSIDE